MRFGQKTAKQIIEQVASNDKSQETLDLTKSASFCMKSLENTHALAEALKTNTVIKILILRECEIVDAGVEALGKALAQNTTIEDVNLEGNKLTTKGVIAFSQGLASNTSVKTLNLMNQSQKVIGEDALEQFILMFETNLTLTKLMWKVDSRRTWHLSKLITRNVEIGRRLAGGAGIEDLLPANLRKGSAVAEATLISSVPTPAAAPASGGYASAETVPVVEASPAAATEPPEEPATPDAVNAAA